MCFPNDSIFAAPLCLFYPNDSVVPHVFYPNENVSAGPECFYPNDSVFADPVSFFVHDSVFAGPLYLFCIQMTVYLQAPCIFFVSK